MDYKAISAAALPHLQDLALELDTGAKREGGEVQLRNPRRADRALGSFSVNASTGLWADFASEDEGSDLVSWWAHCRGLSQSEAARELAERFAPDLLPVSERRIPNPPAPEGVPDPDFTRYTKRGERFAGAWCYRDAHGARLGYALRFDGREGKQVRPLRWGGSAWEPQAFQEPRPLFNLHLLAQRPGTPVLVCEGEKAAEAAGKLLPDLVAVTSPGGSKAAAKADWGPLHDRQVILWPDHDEPGAKYAERVAELARRAGAASIRRVEVPVDFPRAWDLADDPPAGADLPALLAGAVEVDGPGWEHPTLPMAPPEGPWIVADLQRWMREEPPQVRWLLEGLIPAGVPGVLAARSNAGKSMTALSIGLGLASGLGALGLPVSADAARGVVFVSLEDDDEEMHRRTRRGLELLAEDPRWTPQRAEALWSRFRVIFPDRRSGARFSLPDQWKSIARVAQGIPGGCGLIILDTLARLSEGDENSASEMRTFGDAQAALAQVTGAAVLTIHHVGKGNDTLSDRKLWQRLHPEAMRGSSAIEGWCRFILTMAALSPQEAAQAGLDGADAMAGSLVALKLAKASQSEKGGILLLERRQAGEAGAGFLTLHPDSERALAAIQGEAAVAKLHNRERVLLAIAEARGHLGKLDQREAAKLLWPDARDPYGQWRKSIGELRKAGLLGDLHLTDAGWAKVETMGFRMDRDSGCSGGATGAEQAEQPLRSACSVAPAPIGDGAAEQGGGHDDDEGAA